tara:strand:- start:681 stop:1154 length:474 start_codon:yes stop_codon:yes gene_type:complete
MSALLWGKGTRLSLIWAFTYRKLSRSKDKYSRSNAVVLGSAIGYTSFVIFPVTSTKALGWTVRALVANPYAQAAYVPYVAGGVISAVIDPEDGVSNYVGFTTGGMFGAESPNYWNSDPNDSGYFNVPKNVETIVSHYWEGLKNMELELNLPSFESPW